MVIALALMLTYAGRVDEWIGVWSETQNYVGIAFIFAIPAAAGVGAWIGSGNERSGIREQQQGTSRPLIQVAAREYAEPVVWVILGYAAGSAPALIATYLTADVGRPLLLPVLAQVSCLCGVTALGQVIGARMPWYLGAPISAAVAYVGLGFLSFNADRVLLSLTPIDERWMTFHRILWWVLLLQAALWLMIAANAVMRHAGQKRLSFAALVVAGLAAAPLLYVTPATRVVSNEMIEMSCTSRGDLAVCMPRAKIGLENSLFVQSELAASTLAGLFPKRIAFIDDENRGISRAADQQIDLASSRQTADGRALIYFSQAGDLSARTRIDVNQFHYNFIAYAVPAVRASTYNAPPAGEAPPLPQAAPTDVIYRWYLRSLNVPTDGSGGVGAPYLDDAFLDFSAHAQEARAFEDLSDEDRVAWFSKHAATIRAGRLSWGEFAEL